MTLTDLLRALRPHRRSKGRFPTMSEREESIRDLTDEQIDKIHASGMNSREMRKILDEGSSARRRSKRVSG